MEKKWTMTAEELTEYLRTLGIKEEGIQAINENLPRPRQKFRVKSITCRDLEDGTEIKEAVKHAWRLTHTIACQHLEERGKKPREEDFLKL